jgi:ABC-type bacteriocin/lantibiotic exporter with double-glycine peptidase domain
MRAKSWIAIRQALNRRRLVVPEVVQTSNMDCGPASLKCLLQGFGINVSYGRLREACHTSIDGASIDTLTEVAVQLGLDAEQVMLPLEHVLAPEAQALPAIAVVRNSQGLTHFIVIWSARAGLVQVMNPEGGRQWMTPGQLHRWLYIHALAVDEKEWRKWAATEEFTGCLRRHLARLHVGPEASADLLANAAADETWRSLAGLQACVRMMQVVAASAKFRRERKGELIHSLFARVRDTDLSWNATLAKQVWPTIPPQYWSVLPAPPTPDGSNQLLLRGAVLVRARGRRDKTEAVEADRIHSPETEIPPEVAAALEEPPNRPIRDLFRMMRADGLFEPAMLIKALFVGSAAVLIQAILFRGFLDIGRNVNLAQNRLIALAMLTAFMVAVMILNIPVAIGVVRMGRRLEARLRIAILAKLSRLDDRYLKSRLVSDMAERSHSVHMIRQLPGIGFQLLGTIFQLIMTIAGVVWLAPESAFMAVTCAAVAASLPILVQPLLAERDMRVRNHAGALSRFYLDAMLGLIPIRAHAGERAVRYMHEQLLIEWGRAGLRLQRLAISLGAFQGIIGFGLAIWIISAHVANPGEAGSLLLVMFWALSIPALGSAIGSIVCSYPSCRNVALRLMEPLGAPEIDARREKAVQPDSYEPVRAGLGVSIEIDAANLTVTGASILTNINLQVPPGSHVAIVGRSGAGKSSLVGLLLGWSRLSSGTILVDGMPLDGERLKQLRHETAWVDPAIQLWNRSLEYNLRYGSNGEGPGDFSHIIGMAELRDLLESLPDGLQTPLGESGALVSGGEGQRVRFGRAMLRSKARLVILDEPFAALDRPRRERLISKARELWRDATILYITHNIDEALDFPRVLVFDNGRIVEDGCPRELLEIEDSHYRAMYESDAAVRSRFMSSEFWRRLLLRNGRLVERASRRTIRTKAEAQLNDESSRRLESPAPR